MRSDLLSVGSKGSSWAHSYYLQSCPGKVYSRLWVPWRKVVVLIGFFLSLQEYHLLAAAECIFSCCYKRGLQVWSHLTLHSTGCAGQSLECANLCACMCACVFVCVGRGILLACMPQQENFVELVLSIHLHVVAGNWVQITRISQQMSCLQNNLTGPCTWSLTKTETQWFS